MPTARPGGADLPVDARLVAPEGRYEADEGRLSYVAPADEPHGSRHAKVAALVEAHVADDYDVAVDMLTRVAATSDVAPDVSVFPAARSPVTGGRRLEELAFEVVGTQSLGDAAGKASKLAAAGVRRVFAIDVTRQRAFEWSPDLATWSMCASTDAIVDPTLAVPLPIDALVSAAKADSAMARALLRKNTPVLVDAVAQARAEGEATGRARSILAVLARRGIPVSGAQRARALATTDLSRLDAWLDAALDCRDAAALFGPDR